MQLNDTMASMYTHMQSTPTTVSESKLCNVAINDACASHVAFGDSWRRFKCAFIKMQHESTVLKMYLSSGEADNDSLNRAVMRFSALVNDVLHEFHISTE